MKKLEDNSKRILSTLMIVLAIGAGYKLAVKTGKIIYKSIVKKEFITDQMFTESIKKFIKLNDHNKPLDESIPLVEAARKEKLEVVKELLSKGADVNAKDNKGNTALTYALKNQENKNLIQILRSAGAKVE